MSRLIDADLLDEVLDDKFEGCYALDVTYIQDNIIPNIPTVDAVPRELYESMEATCYKLQQALTKSWILCSRELPKEDEEVLVYLYGNVPVIAWVDSGRWCSEEFDIAKEDEPVAWLPLPEPYRGDDQ